MTGTVKLADLLVIFGVTGRIMHIAQMVLALDIVLVVADQLIFIRQFKQDCEEAQKLLNDFGVAFL